MFHYCQWKIFTALGTKLGFTFKCFHFICLFRGTVLHLVFLRTTAGEINKPVLLQRCFHVWRWLMPKCRFVCDSSNAACAFFSVVVVLLFFFFKKRIQFFFFFEIRLGLEGYIHIYAFSVFFLTWFSLLKGKLQCHLQLLSIKFWSIYIGSKEKLLIAVNNVGIINARCHFIEASQQKVDLAALLRDWGNSNQHENVGKAPNCFHHSHANLLNL